MELQSEAVSEKVLEHGVQVFDGVCAVDTGFDAFLQQTVNGRPNVTFDIAALAFNQAGETIGHAGERLHLTLVSDHPTVPICIEQQVDLRKGDDYLYLAVWDAATGRLGSLQIPITVK